MHVFISCWFLAFYLEHGAPICLHDPGDWNVYFEYASAILEMLDTWFLILICDPGNTEILIFDIYLRTCKSWTLHVCDPENITGCWHWVLGPGTGYSQTVRSESQRYHCFQAGSTVRLGVKSRRGGYRHVAISWKWNHFLQMTARLDTVALKKTKVIKRWCPHCHDAFASMEATASANRDAMFVYSKARCSGVCVCIAWRFQWNAVEFPFDIVLCTSVNMRLSVC